MAGATLSLLVAAAGAALVLGLMHFATVTWKLRIQRPQAYTMGVGVLLAAFWLWAWWQGDVAPAIALTVICGAGGAVIKGLWLVNGKYLRNEDWPPQRLSSGQLRYRMIELLEDMQCERAIARDLRQEAQDVDERLDFYLGMLRDPSVWKPDTCYREVKRRAAMEFGRNKEAKERRHAGQEPQSEESI